MHLKSCVFLFVILFSNYAFGNEILKQFCHKRLDNPFVYQEILSQESNRMAFRNYGGMFRGGVCWWHSRFTRNAAYLTYYSPDKKRAPLRRNWKSGDGPSVERVIRKIRRGNEVIEITGFQDFHEFSRFHERQIQRELEIWQRTAGFIHQAWITGLAGASKTRSGRLERRMGDLFERVQRGEVVYQKLQECEQYKLWDKPQYKVHNNNKELRRYQNEEVSI